MICLSCISTETLEMMFKTASYKLMVLTTKDWQPVYECSKHEMIKLCDHIKQLDLNPACDICHQKESRGWVCIDKCCEKKNSDIKFMLSKIL